MKVKFSIKPIPNLQIQSLNKLSTSSRNDDDKITKKNMNTFENQNNEMYTNSNTNTLFEFNIQTINNFKN